MRMRTWQVLSVLALGIAIRVTPVPAQDQQPEPTTLNGEIEKQHKAKLVRPYQPGTAEKW